MSQLKAIQARYPHFQNLFVFLNNEIVFINKEFRWDGCNAREVCDYILNSSYYEKANISRHTDFESFISSIRRAQTTRYTCTSGNPDTPDRRGL